MQREEVEQKTLRLHESGLCCTEAIIASLIECFAGESSNAVPKVGSGFCKGIGKSGEDVCGTVVGAVIALGYLYGRMDKDGDNTAACAHAAEFRRRFMARYGSTNCKDLLKQFGDQENMGKCKQMTADASGMVADLVTGQ